MTVLQDNIYGREIPTGVRKSQVVIGRGGSGNARKSISSASTISTVSTVSSSRFLGSFSSRGTAERSEQRTRRWSSASSDFTSSINLSAYEVADSDRYDLYTIASHSTSTTESGGALSDIPSFISEYTFKTSSRPSSRSTRASNNPSRLSGQSDWLARIPRAGDSSESIPQTIHEASNIVPTQEEGSTIFRNPFASTSTRSLLIYPTNRRRPSEIAPFDEPQEDDDAVSIRATEQRRRHPQAPPSPKSPRKFPLFRKSAPRIDTSMLKPPGSYPLGGSTSRFGQSNETVNIRNNSSVSSGSPVSRRNSSSNGSRMAGLLRVGSRGDN
ncbi:hypothetical protein M408DRAFT_157078 [Serendipita vermifera MAFF 305830]|uniref:Uncharacterized protein n=1 Tax=Serendipita vermifera MAFF 305830 TaxID=933852 RepID=A0A0C3B9S5_SERVB|nr:hypothetical protein M408DRAFT_157078 [Serendipita vermifera MAFF 305830]